MYVVSTWNLLFYQANSFNLPFLLPIDMLVDSEPETVESAVPETVVQEAVASFYDPQPAPPVLR